MKILYFFSAFFAVFVLVVPAVALDLNLSGRCIVEQYSHSNETLSVDDANNTYSSMELTLKPIVTVSDNIKLTTEFTVLQDHVWGTDAQPKFQTDNPLLPAIDSGNNIDWKSAYMTLRTGIGGFLIGRGVEKRWGTGLGDSTGSHGSNSKHKDGILWVVPVGDFISGFGWQHISEADKGHLVSDADFDKSYLFSACKKEKWNAGLLLARYDHKNFVVMEELRKFQKGYSDFQDAVGAYRLASAIFGSVYRSSENMEKDGFYDRKGLSSKAKADGYNSVTRWELEKPGLQIASNSDVFVADLNELMINADVAQALATSSGARIKNGPERSTLSLWVFDPYLIGDFGPYRIEAELLYGWGKIELDRPKKNNSDQEIGIVDVEGVAGTVGIWRNFGALTVGTGATYVQGDNDSYYDGKFSGIGYLESSIDFERGFLLTSDVSRIGPDFGGSDINDIDLGNLAGGPLTVSGTSGYRMMWFESKYSVSENLSVGFLCVGSRADEPPEGWDSEHGIECDFTVCWKIMDNLVFNGTIAYLDTGSFWEAGIQDEYDENYKNVNDTLALHGRLSLEF